jgi:hypothetical protein
VADLATLPSDDRAAVLDLLAPDEERTVRALLTAYDGAAAPDASKTIDPLTVLSPALADLVRSGRGLTTDAHRLLVRCAEDMVPKAPVTMTAPASLQPSLFGRFWSRLSGERA